eukprot:gene6470-6539_t
MGPALCHAAESFPAHSSTKCHRERLTALHWFGQSRASHAPKPFPVNRVKLFRGADG